MFPEPDRPVPPEVEQAAWPETLPEAFNPEGDPHPTRARSSLDQGPVLPSPSTEWPLPSHFGKYHLVRLLGSGGQGATYLALDPDLNRNVVLKVYHAIRSAEDRELILEEGKVLASINSPTIARCFSAELHLGSPCLVMEYVAGHTLEQIHRQQSLSPVRAVELVRRIALGLHEVHLQRVVHRDLKPANVIIGDDGQPHIIDFGLALRLGTSDAGAGSIVGTPAFMAPEQARGETERLGIRSDVFGLGGILYYLLTGSAPFDAPTATQALQRAREGKIDGTALKKESVSTALAQACLKALAAIPSERYSGADEFARALHPFTTQARTRRLVLTGLVAGGVFALAGFGWMLWRWPRTAPQPDTLPEVHVLRGEHKQDLIGAAPLRTGDRLILQCDVPRGFVPSMYWIDSEGKLVRLPAGPVSKAGEFDRLQYPSQGVVPLKGNSGTELILVCARKDTGVGEEEMLKALENSRSWPELPAKVVVGVTPKGVTLPVSRGVGQPERDKVARVMELLEKLRQKLGEEGIYLSGVAFTHQ